jgi:eukaryotic-like serine/threonine-protein kinase
VDIFTAGIVFWETLTHRRLFKPDDPASAISMIVSQPIQRPSLVSPDVPPALDKVVMKALDRNVAARFQSAREFADAIEESIPLASHRKVGGWVERLCGQALSQRALRVSEIERLTFDPDSSKDLEHVLGSRTPGVSPVEPGSAGRPQTLTQLSVSMHIEAPPSPEAPSPHRGWVRRAWPLLVGATVLALLLVAGLRLWPHRTDTRAAASPALPAVPPAPDPLPPPPVVPSAAPAADESASAPAPSEPSTAADARRGSAKPAAARPAKLRRPAAKKNCDPPYYLDFQGIRRVKPQCL